MTLSRKERPPELCTCPTRLVHLGQVSSRVRQTKRRGNEMRNGAWALVALCMLSLTAGCGRRDATVTALPTHMPQPTDSQEAAATLDSASIDPTPVCPPASGEGMIPPAVSIYSITFVVNGLEQVVRGGDALQASPGDEVQVREVTICAGPFSGNGGEACVDFAPADTSGQEIVSEHSGTHAVRVTPGFISISVPSHTWTIDEDWRHISAVLNHWPAEDTEDLDCGGGRCERDDRIIVGFR